MKEQVILDREEYLLLKSKADAHQELLDSELDAIKKEYLNEICVEIKSFIDTGFHSYSFNISNDKFYKEYGRDIESIELIISDGNYRLALRKLAHFMMNIVKRVKSTEDDIIISENLRNEINNKIIKFNSLPWHKKIFYKL